MAGMTVRSRPDAAHVCARQTLRLPHTKRFPPVQIRDAFADLNVEPATSVLHGRKGLSATVYVAPFLTPYANALGQVHGSTHQSLSGRCFHCELTHAN